MTTRAVGIPLMRRLPEDAWHDLRGSSADGVPDDRFTRSGALVVAVARRNPATDGVVHAAKSGGSCKVGDEVAQWIDHGEELLDREFVRRELLSCADGLQHWAG